MQAVKALIDQDLNLLAGGPVIPEHLQNLRPSRIAADLVSLAGPAGDEQLAALAPAMSRLRPVGAVRRVADLARELATR